MSNKTEDVNELCLAFFIHMFLIAEDLCSVMASGVTNIIGTTQITLKLVYNTLMQFLFVCFFWSAT